MVQPKYNPQEALERVKLMMKYDMSKTLNENKSIIFEQVDFSLDAQKIKQELDSFNTDEAEIVRILKNYNTAKSFNEFLSYYEKNQNSEGGLARDLSKGITPTQDKTEVNDLNNHLKTFGMELVYGTSKYDKYGGWVFKGVGKEDEDSIRGDLSQTIIPKGWEKFPCVPTLANKSGSKIESDGAYIIGNFRYYANGRKGNITSKEKSYYTCNDPEFVGKKGGRKTGSKYKTCSEQLPIKFGCKNETIKYIQGPECLGITADGKFGPNTKQALIDKGENGDQIDSGTMIAVCKRSTSTIQPDEITLVDAEDSTKLIE